MSSSNRIRVLVVDDSSVLRGLMTKMVSSDPAIEVVGTATNGKHALTIATAEKPDVILLDIEMPVMDGMAALPLLREALPAVAIIMTSTLTLKGAEITMRALSMGANDFIPKPSTGRATSRVESMKAELIMKIKTHCKRQTPSFERAPARAATPVAPAPAASPVSRPPRMATWQPKIIAIGSSTGGPNALEEVLKNLSPRIELPIVITQHMPPMFTTILARRLNGMADRVCQEAQDGQKLEARNMYVAPGDFHLHVTGTSTQPTIRLSQEPPENFCRPAVDAMFRSLPNVYGGAVLAVVLTGMGEDGKRGAKPIVDAGGMVIAQDQKTSVVWGMPGAVANAGLAEQVLPLSELSGAIERICNLRIRA